MWAVGTNTSNIANARIFCIKPNKAITSVPFPGTLRYARVLNGYLFVAGVQNAVHGIWRAQILGDSLAASTMYFDLTAAYGASAIANGFAVAANGTIFLGTTTPQGVIVVNPSGTYGAPFQAYESLMSPGMRSFAWGQGDALFGVSTAGKLLQFVSRTSGAPYYGH
jgi:hypothetical protein